MFIPNRSRQNRSGSRLTGMLGLLLLLAQVQAAPAAGPPPKPALALVDQARSLPAEFGADLLLRIAASALVPEPRWKREWIEEAFATAARAQLPYLQRAVGLAADARLNQEHARNGLEALTLRTRAIQAMLRLDPRRALAMFQEISLVDLPRPACDTPLVTDVSSYYATAEAVFANAFTPKQRADEADLNFLKQIIAGIQAPAQVPPALRIILTLPLAAETRRTLLSAFAIALDRVSGPDREFGTTEPVLVPGAAPELMEAALFVPSLRSYILRQITGPRCTDHRRPQNPFVKLPVSAQNFNGLLARLGPAAAQYKLITADDAKPGKDDGTFQNQFPWQSERSKQVLEALRWLNHGNRKLTGNQRFWTLEERETPAWNLHYLDTLQLVEGWQASEEESPEDYFYMASQTHSRLAALVPPGKARDNAMQRFLSFLEQSYAIVDSRNLWFSQLDERLKTARNSPDPADRVWIIEHLLASPNPAIALYAKVEKLVGAPGR